MAEGLSVKFLVTPVVSNGWRIADGMVSDLPASRRDARSSNRPFFVVR